MAVDIRVVGEIDDEKLELAVLEVDRLPEIRISLIELDTILTQY